MFAFRPYYLLDTNIVSEPVKQVVNSRVTDKLQEYMSVSAVSSITLAEMWKGITLLKNGSYRQMDLMNYFTNEVCALYQEIPFDHHAALVYGEIFAALQKEGRPKPEMDLLIAATAIANNMVLVTRNTKDFEDIPGLMLENWYEPEDNGTNDG